MEDSLCDEGELIYQNSNIIVREMPESLRTHPDEKEYCLALDSMEFAMSIKYSNLEKVAQQDRVKGKELLADILETNHFELDENLSGEFQNYLLEAILETYKIVKEHKEYIEKTKDVLEKAACNNPRLRRFLDEI